MFHVDLGLECNERLSTSTIFFFSSPKREKNTVAVSGDFFICRIILLVTYKTIMTINK